jgi:cell division transport system permease protein
MTAPSYRTDPPRSRPRYGRSIVSVALVLFLLGFFGLVILQAQRLIALLKEEINLIVEVSEEANREEKAALQE